MTPGACKEETKIPYDEQIQESGFDRGIRWKLKLTFTVTLIITFHICAIYAFIRDIHSSLGLLILMCLTYCGLFYVFVVKKWLDRIAPKVAPFAQKLDRLWNKTVYGTPLIKVCSLLLLIAAFVVWVIADSTDSRIRLRSLVGFAMYILIAFLLSANPAKVKWRPVICAVILQITVAFLVLRWRTGHEAFQWFSEQVVTFLDYGLVGAASAYGFVAAPPKICGMVSVFIFSAIQILIYFGAIVSVLYYLGIIETVLTRVAWLMQNTIGTTAAESLNAAGCIFLGQAESAVLIGPALKTMTDSEIHAVMSAGFACIAGSLFSAYISFGACPTYLLSATVMAASISLALSKLMYPEVQKSNQKEVGSFKFATRNTSSILECLCDGAWHSSKLVWAIAANLIVYIALLACLNTVVAFFGSLVDMPDLTFNKILGYCFFPFAYMLGASDAEDPVKATEETLIVAELIGVKTALNEFIAYQQLSQLISTGQLTGKRAKMIATYALCGFSNISMIGTQIGILSALCPQRKSSFSRVAVRALITGILSCCMTACVAGILISEPKACKGAFGDGCLDLNDVETFFNSAQYITQH